MTITITPVFFADGTRFDDIQFGKVTTGVFPPELLEADEELGETIGEYWDLNDFEVYQTGLFRLFTKDETPRLIVDNTGNADLTGWLQVRGGQIRNKSGLSSITLADNAPDVSLAGNVSVTNNLTVGQNIVAGGTITGTAKFFDVPYPNVPGYRIRHAALEGPEHAIFYRGVLQPYQTQIDHPEYYIALAQPVSTQIFFGPGGEDIDHVWYKPTQIAVMRKAGVDHSRSISYFVIGTRQDIEPLVPIYQGTT